jgi:hypothetical protein
MDLSRNKLKLLHQLMFEANYLKNIEHIILNDNQLAKCEVYFDNLKIISINVAGNNLTDVPYEKVNSLIMAASTVETSRNDSSFFLF